MCRNPVLSPCEETSMPPRMKHQILPARRLHVPRCKLASRESIPGGACADSSANMGTCRGINSSAAGGGGDRDSCYGHGCRIRFPLTCRGGGRSIYLCLCWSTCTECRLQHFAPHRRLKTQGLKLSGLQTEALMC